MSMITGARSWVELPAPEPLGGGVLSVATVIDNPANHELMGVEGQTDLCATIEEWSEWCTMTPTGRKVFAGMPDAFVGDPFAIYAGVSCDLQTLEASKQRAIRRLAYGESRAIDFHVVADLDSSTDVVDLGGPFPLSEAIGVAEAFAATVYGGRPTLLIPRVSIPCGGFGQFESAPNGTLSTVSGTLVAPLTTPITIPVTDTSETLFVTGSIVLFRSEVLAVSVPQQVADDGSFAPMRALAERVIVPVFDCLVAKVEVTCS